MIRAMENGWTVVRFLHLGAVSAWIGGMLFLGLVAVPVARAIGGPEGSRAMITATARRFAALAGVAWATILLSGFGLLHHRGLSFSDLPDSAYGRRVLTKFVILVVVGLMAVAHGLWQGPKVRRAESVGDTAAAKKWKAVGGVLDGLMLLLSLVALWLAAALVT